ncbi:MAG: TSUP family transporter [Crocinitomicaceae bacterium]
MDVFILIVVAFGASWLTFFSGFGLGTLLTPVFYFIFQDVVLAITGTAIVHFLNNVFKFTLMQKSIDWKIAIPFGLAAIPAAFLGSQLIFYMEDKVVFVYEMAGGIFEVRLFNLIFSLILLVFALIELIPKWSLIFSRQSLWVGGFISGFFGGLSGHQGALRTAFLIRYKLDKEVFIATGILVALVVDVVRTTVYFTEYDLAILGDQWHYLLIALPAALIGAITGKLLLKKMKMKFLTNFISVAMIVFAVALSAGWLNG